MNGVDISQIKRPGTPWALSPDGLERLIVEVILDDGQRLTWDDEGAATLHTPPASTCTCDPPGKTFWIVDRGRRTTMAQCNGCGAKWDNPDGEREFFTWADGFVRGKQATYHQASQTPDPSMGAWAKEYSDPETDWEVAAAGIEEERRRVEPDTQDDIDYGPKAPAAVLPLVGWPEWFLPLMKLRGFTYGQHREAIDDIATGCKAMGVTPELVVAAFVAYWMPRRDSARWECPVFGLWDELGHWINDVYKATPHRRAAVLEMASASVGAEYGCRYCNESGFIWVDDLGPGGSADRWPVVCDHTSQMKGLGQEGPPGGSAPLGFGMVIKALGQRLPPAIFTSWVMDLELLGFDDQVALVRCYNRTHANWVYRHLIETLRDALDEELESYKVKKPDLKMMMVWGVDNGAETA